MIYVKYILGYYDRFENMDIFYWSVCFYSRRGGEKLKGVNVGIVPFSQLQVSKILFIIISKTSKSECTQFIFNLIGKIINKYFLKF